MRKGIIFSALTALIAIAVTLPALADDAKPIGQTIYEVIKSQGVEAGVAKYRELKKKQADVYDFSETELNALGYKFISENNLEAAKAVFELNTEAYPKSPNAFDSLGEVYLRMGKKDPAIEMYEKAIALLDQPGIDDNTRTALKQNADAKLAYLRAPDEYKSSTAVRDFRLNNPEHPFGRLHPKAPPETEHWGKLAGEWDCTIQALLPNGNWVQGGNAKWVWKYILDGFAIQDLWYQKWVDLPASLAGINRDLVGTNVRIYNPSTEKWDLLWLVNRNNSTSRFEAVSSDEKIVMTGTNAQGNPVRITFFNMTDTDFDWKSENSQDDGETWQETLRIHGTRAR